MKLEIEHLAAIDPARVVLPRGTEIETRARCLVGERVVPNGAIGRVKASRGDRIVVDLVGIGEVELERSDVAPRRAGQARYAVRREALWAALEKNIVLETTVGSRAWGLADEESDTDKRGVFALPFPWTTGLAVTPGELTDDDGSATYWEIEKAVRQALRADPNTLEMLFIPSANATDEVGQWLLDGREAFVSAKIYGSFGRYALGQLKRLRGAKRLADHRGLVLEWLREEALSLDATAERLASAAAVAGTPAEAALRAKEYIKQLYSSLFDRGLVRTRDFEGLLVYARAGGEPPEVGRDLRPKNAYNLLRLIASASHWLDQGRPRFVCEEPLLSELAAIKRGEVPLETVLARADELAGALEAARLATALPAEPDLQAADALLSRVRLELARRFTFAEPGPFGLDCPPRPLLVIE